MNALTKCPRCERYTNPHYEENASKPGRLTMVCEYLDCRWKLQRKVRA